MKTLIVLSCLLIGGILLSACDMADVTESESNATASVETCLGHYTEQLNGAATPFRIIDLYLPEDGAGYMMTNEDHGLHRFDWSGDSCGDFWFILYDADNPAVEIAYGSGNNTSTSMHITITPLQSNPMPMNGVTNFMLVPVGM